MGVLCSHIKNKKNIYIHVNKYVLRVLIVVGADLIAI